MHIKIQNLSNNLIRQKIYVKIFFVIFYIVGIIGLKTSYSHHFFIGLIPFVLLLSFTAILIFHQFTTGKFVSVLLIICLLGYCVEVIGVNTQLIFGSYTYGNGLGFKLFNTPILIGINWFFLVYCSAVLVDKLRVHTIFKILFAALLMLLYDIILERIAPTIDMWHWENNIVPLQNYVAWFVIAVLFQCVIKAGIKIQNQIAGTIFVCQALFFLSLIFFNVSK
jgi:bisanhydrobacterioruberin hydratase